MNNINKSNLIIKKAVIFCVILFSLTVFLLPNINIALAASGPDQLLYGGTEIKTETQSVLGLGSKDPRIIIASVIRVLLGFLGILAVGLIMYGGWLYMTSEGDEKKIETAKNIIKDAVIGLIIILSSFALASFILKWLYDGTTGNNLKDPGDLSGRGRGIGIIGACSVESVFPEPYQEDVPRNTAIIVTFKEEIFPSSICAKTDETFDDPNTPANEASIKCQEGSAIRYVDGVPVVKIYQSALSDKCNSKDDDSCLSALVYTRDNKTFVFVMNNYLGSASEKIWHTVHLTNDIQSNQINPQTKVREGVFSHCRGQDYLEWSFNVSTKLDLVPPQVRELKENGIFPWPDNTQGIDSEGNEDIAKNVIIKLNFSEGVNPYTISGDAEVIHPFIKVVCEDCTDNDNEVFNCVKTPAKPATDTEPEIPAVYQKCVKGNFELASGYSTVEFVSKNKCGTNNCGEDIFCLPGGKEISVQLNASSLMLSCNNDTDCATRSPYAICASGHCQALACNDDNDCSARNPKSKCNNKKCQIENVNNPLEFIDNPINYPLGKLDGVVDLAMNSLDGNRNYSAEGKGNTYNENDPSTSILGDNYTWSFWTSNEFNLEPPTITSVTQKIDAVEPEIEPDQSNIDLLNPFAVLFNKIMMATSLKTYSVKILDNIHEGVNLMVLDVDANNKRTVSLATTTNYWITSLDVKSGANTTTKMSINHDMLLDDTYYRGQVGSRVKDIFQNCYMPCVGPNCDGTPSCCNGTPASSNNCN